MNETHIDHEAKSLAERAIIEGDDDALDELSVFINVTKNRLGAAESLSWTSTILDMEDRLATVRTVAERAREDSDSRDRAVHVLQLLDGEAEGDSP